MKFCPVKNQLKDIGEFSSVKNQMDINKVYYWNKYEKSGWWPWTYDKSVGMGTAAVSGNVYAKYPVKYRRTMEKVCGRQLSEHFRQ